MIVGATGQLGSGLVTRATAHPGVRRVIAASREANARAVRIDLTEPATAESALQTIRPHLVILAAAATNVAWCEANPGKARQVNVDGTAAVAEACRRVDARLVFYSTDYVFDGAAGPYAEDAPTHPINIYGAHKLEAEQAVLGESDRNLVIRTCQVFGEDRHRRNYVLRVADQLRHGEAVRAAVDLFGTPTYAADLATVTLELIDQRASGVWHVGGPDFVSRHELALQVASCFGLDASTIEASGVDEMPDGVERPRLAGLRCTRLGEAAIRLRSLAEALADLAARDTH